MAGPTYRDSLSDAYLDGPIVDERRDFWRQRLQHPAPDLWVMLATLSGEGALAGFACALLHHDVRWGTLIDNLHADPAVKRRGLGRTLMAALGDHLDTLESAKPVHLFVLQANHAANDFYQALGGEPVETLLRAEPDGSTPPAVRIVWRSVADFRAQGRRGP